MQLFYATDIHADRIVLDAEEARHLRQVLRKGPGDRVEVVDGKGQWFDATVAEQHRGQAMLRIDGKRQQGPRAGFRLHLAVAPTKNSSRFEWLLEKATEIGVDEITPLECFHSERRRLRPARLRRVLVAAMKQSLTGWLPRLHPMTPFERFVDRGLAPDERGFLAHLGEASEGALADNYLPGTNVTILIGPEGDFSREEIGLARRAGFRPVTLGPTRLRTETAGIVACHTVNLLQTL